MRGKRHWVTFLQKKDIESAEKHQYRLSSEETDLKLWIQNVLHQRLLRHSHDSIF